MTRTVERDIAGKLFDTMEAFDEEQAFSLETEKQRKESDCKGRLSPSQIRLFPRNTATGMIVDSSHMTKSAKFSISERKIFVPRSIQSLFSKNHSLEVFRKIRSLLQKPLNSTAASCSTLSILGGNVQPQPSQRYYCARSRNQNVSSP